MAETYSEVVCVFFVPSCVSNQVLPNVLSEPGLNIEWCPHALHIGPQTCYILQNVQELGWIVTNLKNVLQCESNQDAVELFELAKKVFLLFSRSLRWFTASSQMLNIASSTFLWRYYHIRPQLYHTLDINLGLITQITSHCIYEAEDSNMLTPTRMAC